MDIGKLRDETGVTRFEHAAARFNGTPIPRPATEPET
jgi:hypothetical protein